MDARVSRNAPCPCGSGKKYKVCCESRQASGGGRSGKILTGVVIVAVVGGLAVAIGKFFEADSGPEPWVYNAVTNQYFDPTPDHRHWHNGRPPAQPGSATPAIDPAALLRAGTAPDNGPPATVQPSAPPVPTDGTPTPWQYDAENDRHWNPDNALWDEGMPPLEAFTSQ